MLILKKINKKALLQATAMSPVDVVNKIKLSKLTGRGGANFPTGIKWNGVFHEKSCEKYLICNADEGEVATFKDKYIFNNNPEIVVEGMAIAAYAIGITKSYIYLRKEYEYLIDKIQKAIDQYNEIDIKIILGAGSYLCGDETVIMNSIEGELCHPRKKPPYPVTSGLFGKPTVINNVETLANIPLIFTDDTWHANMRLFSLSGDVRKGCVVEESLGITYKKLMDKAEPIEPIKALFFGASGGCCLYNDDNILSLEEVAKDGASLGSCSIIAVGASTSIVDVCCKIQEFFVHENCGKCVPCREGNWQVLKILHKFKNKTANKEDLSLLKKLSHYIAENSFCSLGKSSPTHVLTSVKYFEEEFLKRCK
jgi:NADH-quinone oxidoreductase subunit F